jgi:hypothetical protein
LDSDAARVAALAGTDLQLNQPSQWFIAALLSMQ